MRQTPHAAVRGCSQRDRGSVPFMVGVLIDQVIGGKYRITSLIGQGGMGTVFEAIHTGTGSRVAIKVIVSNEVKHEVFVRFQREARAAGTIDSQHIVRVFDMGSDEQSGSPFMVMERLYGEDVAQLMRRVGPLSPPIAVGLAAQAALGLAKAHAAGVVHRDIKPANLFLHDGNDRGEVTVKILDFGIAKVLMDVMQRQEEGGLTRTGSMLGSPHYMSPEQAQGLRTIDHRTDIWSLGVVLYKMLAGQTPHAHLQTLGQVILAICSQRPRPVQELAPWVPSDLAAIVERALQPDPAQRFQNAEEMYAALSEAARAAGTPAVIRRNEIEPLSNEQRMRIQTAPIAFPRVEIPTNGTQIAMSHAPTPTMPAPTRSSAPWLAAFGILATVGLGGAGLAIMARKQAAAKPLTTIATATAPTTTIAPPAVSAATKTVALQVSPPNAVVEVDGQKREATDGVVTLTGAPGAVAIVHVSASGGEITQNVAITEGGAFPPRIVVTPVVTAPTATFASKLTKGSGGASGKPTPSATGTALNAQRTFE